MSHEMFLSLFSFPQCGLSATMRIAANPLNDIRIMSEFIKTAVGKTCEVGEKLLTTASQARSIVPQINITVHVHIEKTDNSIHHNIVNTHTS